MRSRTAPLLLVAAALLVGGCTLEQETPTPRPVVAVASCLPTYEILGAIGAWRIAGYSDAALLPPSAEDMLRYDDGLISGSGALNSTAAARVLELGERILNAEGFGRIEPLPGETARPTRALDLAAIEIEALERYLARTTLRIEVPGESGTPLPSESAKKTTPQPSPSPTPTEPSKDGESAPDGPRFYGLIAVPTISIEARLGHCEEDENGEFLAYEEVAVLTFDARLDEVQTYGVSCEAPLAPMDPVVGDPYLPLDVRDLARIHSWACSTLSA